MLIVGLHGLNWGCVRTADCDHRHESLTVFTQLYDTGYEQLAVRGKVSLTPMRQRTLRSDDDANHRS